MTSNYEVYWIHLESHTDVRTQGYVGITRCGADKRFQTHKRNSKKPEHSHKTISKAIQKYGGSILLTILCFCSKSYAKQLEFNLRSSPFIGWNMNVGGGHGPELTASEKQAAAIKRKATMEGREIRGELHWNWKGGVSLERHIKKPWTEEKRLAVAKKVSEKLSGRPLSAGHKQKLSDARAGKYTGLDNPFSDKAEYTFVRLEDGFEITCTRSELVARFNLGEGIKKLFGKCPRKSSLGWRLK